MILTCPKCSTRYLTKDDAIHSNGRTVRCAKCETTWFVSADEANMSGQAEVDPDALALADNQRDPIMEVGEDDKPLTNSEELGGEISSKASLLDAAFIAKAGGKGAHVSLRDKADAEKLSRRRRIIAGIWAVPITLLGIAAILGFIFRQDIVNRVPETASLYKGLGVTVKHAGLQIENPIAKTSLIDGQAVLIVNSAVKNLSTKTQNLPLVELTLRNGANEPLVQWYVELDQSKLGAKGRLEFASQFPDPPVDTVKLTYKFTE
ncbi:MAG: MJ0042-type zinc finger domain-containing protein [Litorimonas sp.]